MRADGVALPLGTRKRQVVLALLAVNAGRPVSLDDLVDELWPEDPPASAVANVRGYASALRRALASVEPGSDRLVRQGSGYLLHADADELDLLDFAASVAAARKAARSGETSSAAIRFGAALDLWAGPMLSGVPRGPGLTARCAAVEDERLTVIEELADARLALDEPGEAVALLREHVRANPLRERAHLLLMRGLHRAGDVAGALAAYAGARAALAGQLGIEPGAELQQLHRAILNREPAPGGETASSGRAAAHRG